MIKPDNPIKDKTEPDLSLQKIAIQALRMWGSGALMMFVVFSLIVFFEDNGVGLWLGLSAALHGSSAIIVVFTGFTIGRGRLAEGIIYFSAGYLMWFLLNLLASLLGDFQLGSLLYSTLDKGRGLLKVCLIVGLFFRLLNFICLYLDKNGRL